MSIIDRVFALRSAPVFAQLRESELVLIAAAAWPRTYQPGEVIASPGSPLRHLYVIVEGSATSAGRRELPKAFGAASLLFGLPLDAGIQAGENGATCLLLRRAHFHTMVRECPGLVVGLLQGEENAARAA